MAPEVQQIVLSDEQIARLNTYLASCGYGDVSDVQIRELVGSHIRLDEPANDVLGAFIQGWMNGEGLLSDS